MKIKDIGALCRKSKYINLLDEENRQWCGDYTAVYSLPESLQGSTKQSLYAIFDVPEDKAEEFFFKQKEFDKVFDPGDDVDGERELSWDISERVIKNNMDMLPLSTPDGEVYFIQTKYLKPVNDSDNLRLYLQRNTGGHPCVAVKDGLFLVAMIMAIEVRENLTKWLCRIYNGAEKVRKMEAQHAETD